MKGEVGYNRYQAQLFFTLILISLENMVNSNEQGKIIKNLLYTRNNVKGNILTPFLSTIILFFKVLFNY